MPPDRFRSQLFTGELRAAGARQQVEEVPRVRNRQRPQHLPQLACLGVLAFALPLCAHHGGNGKRRLPSAASAGVLFRIRRSIYV